MGEITIHVTDLKILSKSIRPLPVVKEVTDDKGDTYTKVTENQTGGGASQGYSYTPKDPKPVKDKQYSHPAMGGKSVTVGPRAGVMAEKPRTGPDLTKR